MFALLLTLLLIDGVLLGIVVLLQAGKGGGLASMGGGAGTDNSLIGGRQAATILTKTSWICGGTFMALALALSILSSRNAQPESILRDEFGRTPAQQAQPGPVQLPGAQQNAPAGGANPQPAPPTQTQQ